MDPLRTFKASHNQKPNDNKVAEVEIDIFLLSFSSQNFFGNLKLSLKYFCIEKTQEEEVKRNLIDYRSGIWSEVWAGEALLFSDVQEKFKISFNLWIEELREAVDWLGYLKRDRNDWHKV